LALGLGVRIPDSLDEAEALSNAEARWCDVDPFSMFWTKLAHVKLAVEAALRAS
jgi:hypothetical protein